MLSGGYATRGGRCPRNKIKSRKDKTPKTKQIHENGQKSWTTTTGLDGGVNTGPEGNRKHCNAAYPLFNILG